MRKTLIALSLLACCSANALITMSLWDDSYNGQNGVMFSSSGSANTEALTYQYPVSSASLLNLPYALLRSSSSEQFDRYSGITGPTDVGTGGYLGTYISGDSIGVFGYDSSIYLPKDYVSGSLVSSQSFFQGATIAAMGFTIGDTFEWTWGSGENADKVVLEIRSGPPVPEPSTYAAMIAVVTLVTVYVVRRRSNKATA